jgi:hypothetical protein
MAEQLLFIFKNRRCVSIKKWFPDFRIGSKCFLKLRGSRRPPGRALLGELSRPPLCLAPRPGRRSSHFVHQTNILDNGRHTWLPLPHLWRAHRRLLVEWRLYFFVNIHKEWHFSSLLYIKILCNCSAMMGKLPNFDILRGHCPVKYQNSEIMPIA